MDRATTDEIGAGPVRPNDDETNERDRDLEADDDRGVTIQVYRPTGRPQTGTATTDMKHVT
jgi:hypothetical protein